MTAPMRSPVSLRRVLDFPPPARNPFVHVLAFGAFVQGLGIFAGSPAPGSTEAILPRVLLYVWAGGLVGFWVILVLAAFWRDVVTGVLIEGIACAVAILATGAYAIGAVTVLGQGVLLWPVLTTCLYAPAAAVRLWQIVRAARRVHAVLTKGATCPPGQ